MLLCFTLQNKAQDTAVINYLLRRIAEKQVTKDSFYHRGMFPSFRYYAADIYKAKSDNNIFFTGLIAFTLQELQSHFTANEKQLSEKIILQAKQAYSYFKNAGGRRTYSFWAANPPEVFPNSWFLNFFRKSNALPDDIDDTAILLLAMQAPDSIAKEVKLLMNAHANTVHYGIQNTFRRYKNIPAYSTWIGEKMPIDFDFCVLCNALYFTHAYRLTEDKYDSATIMLLQYFIQSRQYILHPAYISPHYERMPVLLYHIARLIGKFPIPALIKYKPQLIADARDQLNGTKNFMDKIILSTALLRLGDTPPALALPDNIIAAGENNNEFIFFTAGFYSMLPNPFKRLLSHWAFIKYLFTCPAYNDVLILEYLSLSKV